MNTRNQYHELLKNYSVGLEVGVEYGAFAEQILQNWEGRLVCVDFWGKQPNYNEPPNDKNFIEMFDIFNQKMIPFSDRVLIVKNLSEVASRFFPENYFDFIFIDANHEYSSIKKDMEVWWPKLKSGGLFSGHDWLHNFNPTDKNMSVYFDGNYIGEYGVNSAVSEFCEKNNYGFKVTNEEFATWYFYKR